MKRSLVLLFLPVLVTPHLTAQEWTERMLDPDANVHEVKQAFDAYWQGRAYERGKGWKQFERWYWFWEQRTFPGGDLPAPDTYAKAWEQLRAMRPKGRPKSANWTPLGPLTWNSTSYNPGNGRVNVMAEEPGDPNTLYVGSPAGGLWRSTDAGGTWNAVFDDLPSLGVSGIAIDPNNTDILYVATGDGDGADTYSLGVLKSTDGGTTWSTTGLDWSLSQARTTRALRMHPTNSQVLFCATNAGLWRTLDGGTSWTLVSSGSFRDIEFKPGDPNTVYACTDQFFRSTDGGATFTQVTSALPADTAVNRMSIAVSPQDPAVVYVLCGREDDSGFKGLYRSTDSGQQFTLRSSSPNLFAYDQSGADSGGQSWYDMALCADPANAQIVYVGGINVWRSTNGGTSWAIRSHWVYPSSIGYTHADIHWLDMVGNRLYCGSDGGAFRSTTGGSTWTDISAGLNIMQFYRFGGSDLQPARIIAGAQDNGTNLRNNGVWTHVIGADGMDAAIDPSDPDIMYGSFQNGGIMRSYDYGQSFDNIGSGIPEDGPWVTPYAIDRTMPEALVACYNNVWRTTDYGDNWSAISNWNTNGSGRCLAIAPSDGNVIYVARTDLFRRSTTAGTPWTNINSGLPQLAVTSIAVHPNDPMTLYISLSGFTQGEKVYVSTNGGGNWTNISRNLPNAPANSVVIQPGTNGGIYVGTDLGVFYTDSTLSNWQPFSDGLPTVVVTELEVNLPAGKLRASTYGRGMWETGLHTPSNAPPVAQFGTSSTSICAGEAITFTDLSLEAAPGWSWQFPGGTPASSTAASPSVVYPSTGIYLVTLTMSNGFGTDSQTLPVSVVVQPHSVDVDIVVDDYPNETTWTITDDGTGEVMASGGPYAGAPSGSQQMQTACLPDGCYTFTINDSYGDGICCGYGNGSYTVSTDTGVVASGGQFTFTESTPFCLSTSVGIAGAEDMAAPLLRTLGEGRFVLSWNEAAGSPVPVVALDATGRTVYSTVMGAGSREVMLDLSALSAGSYMLQAWRGAAPRTMRVVR